MGGPPPLLLLCLLWRLLWCLPQVEERDGLVQQLDGTWRPSCRRRAPRRPPPAGVRICRTVGTAGLRNLDPFLMLDELKMPSKEVRGAEGC